MNRILLILLLWPMFLKSQNPEVFVMKTVASQSSQYEQWYKNLHTHPELSSKELNTSAQLKEYVKNWGFEIIDSLGMHSFAAVLKNGNGPVVLYRTDMDGLPVKEQTGLDFASTSIQENNAVMHACGHDIHMSTWLGTAQLLSQNKNQWKGTLVLLAQSAEETGQGAKAVLASLNHTKIPVADFQLAMHDHAQLPAGKIGLCDGYAFAAVDMLNITIFGRPGHGAAPDLAIDPIVLSAQFINNIQTIISRNLNSNDPAIITVGAINGGTIGNVIPDNVQLKLTIRSYSSNSRDIIFKRLKTIADNLALASGLDSTRLPKFELLDMSIPSVYNDPELGSRLRNMINISFGSQAYENVKPVMIGEDFGIYGRTNANAKSYIIWMGTVGKERMNQNIQENKNLPSLHSSTFAPDYNEVLPASVSTLSTIIYKLLKSEKQLK
ncbi:MAG: M20 metallopeptidase family protein [Chitinophagaceae bacterium]